jgi:hypothetical protein
MGLMVLSRAPGGEGGERGGISEIFPDVRIRTAGKPCSQVMALNKSFKHNNGSFIPAFSFGTWRVPSYQVEIAVEHAIRTGYRHTDRAPIYRNEGEVGRGMKKNDVKR